MPGNLAPLTLLLVLAGLPTLSAAPLDQLSLDQLEHRKRAIDLQLGRLATYSLGSGIGAIGFRSPARDTPDQPEWIEVTVEKPVPLDEIVLVPTIRRDSVNGFQADAFPVALRVLAGIGAERKPTLIAEFTRESGLLPRIAPLVIPGRGISAEWIRVEAVTLSPRAFDGRHVFQLAEVLAFSGEENVALRRPVRSSAGSTPSLAPGWAEAYVTDGALPYLMAAGAGQGSVAFLNPFALGDDPAITIDLGAVHRVERIHLHAIDQSDTVPQAFAGDIGIPALLRIEGARDARFSDAMTLAEIRHATIYDVGLINMWSFPAAECRYVRFRPVGRNVTNPLYGPNVERFGFAEIELFAGKTNVALHRPVSANFRAEGGMRQLANLTDGLNFYGPILPVREWLSQLATRHELERERPRLVAAIEQRHGAHRRQLVGLAWLAGLLALGVIGVTLVSRIQRRHAIEQTRNRIAADLHDELGADLHAIGLIADLARQAAPAEEKLRGLLQRIRSLTERAGQAARYGTNLLEAPGLFGDLAGDLHRTAARLLADLEHRIEIEDSDIWKSLAPRRRTDLILFYQECLTNVIRHSGATRVETRLRHTAGKIHLTVADNGLGLPGPVPASLARRSRLLGAHLSTQKSSAGGLQIDLRLKPHRLALFG